MHGKIEVVCGCMFSGKSTELIRRVERATVARQTVMVFKPKIDDRYSATKVCSHGSASVESFVVDSVSDIADEVAKKKNVHVVAIDEGQFLGEELISLCEKLSDKGTRVIVAGLDQDYKGRPFGPMGALLAIADSVTKLDAVCVVCGGSASKTFRTSKSKTLVQIGSQNAYEARCRRCYNMGMRKTM